MMICIFFQVKYFSKWKEKKRFVLNFSEFCQKEQHEISFSSSLLKNIPKQKPNNEAPKVAGGVIWSKGLRTADRRKGDLETGYI